MEWQSEANHPTMLRNSAQHWRRLTSGGYVLARKVSYTHSRHLLARLYVHLRSKRMKELLNDE
jgi:hypothetical protein